MSHPNATIGTFRQTVSPDPPEIPTHEKLRLGNNVTVVRIPKAVHDIFLSPAPVRKNAYREMERWLGGYLNRRA